jgi:hypothetical protein
MTSQERVAAVEKAGFTRRQAAFLVTVMVHSGVCLGRQYCAFSRIVRGQKMQDFFSSLVTRRVATAYAAAHRRAWVYHVHSKRLYASIGEPNNRNRKPVTLARALERLMLLDAVIAEPSLRWLGSEPEKVEHFGRTTTLRVSELPALSFGMGAQRTVRFFPDKLPIGVANDERTHVFVYLINRETPVDFRAFLHRHAELFRALPEWELRLLVPGHLARSVPLFEAAVRQEIAMPLRLDDVDELAWFFRQRLAADGGRHIEDEQRFRTATRRFHAPRYRTMYRLWKKVGDGLVHATVSRVLSDALARRTGRIKTVELSHPYQQLTPLVGSA